MALSDHFRELRARLIRSALVLVIAFIVALFFYDQLLDFMPQPYNAGQSTRSRTRTTPSWSPSGIGAGLLLQMKLCGVAAIVVSAPYWLYQIWAFILPGLHANEKKYSRVVRGHRRPAVLRAGSRWATTCCPRASRC